MGKCSNYPIYSLFRQSALSIHDELFGEKEDAALGRAIEENDSSDNLSLEDAEKEYRKLKTD